MSAFSNKQSDNTPRINMHGMPDMPEPRDFADNADQSVMRNHNMRHDDFWFDASVGQFKHRRDVPPNFLLFDATVGQVKFKWKESDKNTNGSNTPAPSSHAPETPKTSTETAETGDGSESMTPPPHTPDDPIPSCQKFESFDDGNSTCTAPSTHASRDLGNSSECCADGDGTDITASSSDDSEDSDTFSESDAEDADAGADDGAAASRTPHAHVDVLASSDSGEDSDDAGSISEAPLEPFDLEDMIIDMDDSGKDDIDIADMNAADVDAADVSIAALAPYAPEDLSTFNKSVGEILTQESWRKILAGIPADEELKRNQPYFDNEPTSCIPKPLFEDALNTQGSNSATPPRSELEDNTYSVTPPPAAVEDPYDSDYHYGKAEVESDGDPFLDNHDAGDEEDDDLFADIPLPKEDSEDEDFVLPNQKWVSGRKALATGSARAHKQSKKTGSRGWGGSHPAQVSAHQPGLMPESNVVIVSHHNGRDAPKRPGVTASKAELHVQQALPESDDDEPQKPGDSRKKRKLQASQVTSGSQIHVQAGPSAAPINIAPVPTIWAKEEILLKDRPKHALQLHNKIAGLREEVKLAEVRYDEAAKNPRVTSDPRTKKRRLTKLEEIREELRQAVMEQVQFVDRYGSFSGPAQGATTQTLASTASSSIATATSNMPTRLQVLEKEVKKWRTDIQDLRRKVAHCKAQLDDVQANPQKFVNKRAGFEKGRETRLRNAQHNLSFSIQKLGEQERLYAEEYQRVHDDVAFRGQSGQLGQQQRVPAKDINHVKTAAGHHMQLQSSALQTSNYKRKASEMMEEEEGSGCPPVGSSA